MAIRLRRRDATATPTRLSSNVTRRTAYSRDCRPVPGRAAFGFPTVANSKSCVDRALQHGVVTLPCQCMCAPSLFRNLSLEVVQTDK